MNLKKFDCKKNFKRIWWIILLAISSLYVYVNYSTISNKPTSIDLFVVVLFSVLLFMPMASEISFLGISLKKDIEETRRELKEDILDLKLQMIQIDSSSSSKVNNYIGDGYLPSKEEVEKNIESVKSNVKQDKASKEDDNYDAVTEQQISLFKNRLIIEKKLIEVMNALHLNGNKPIRIMINRLHELGIISDSLHKMIIDVSMICNRGVHGEVVELIYIKYVKSVVPIILEELNKIIENPPKGPLRSCENCGYRGYLLDSNCPNCGFVTDKV